MKPVSMKLPKRKKSNMVEKPIAYGEGEKYPWGLRITLEKEQVKQLSGAKNLQVGNVVNLTGLGKVTSVSMEEMAGDDGRHSISIQIESLAVEKKKSLAEMDMKEYRDARSGK